MSLIHHTEKLALEKDETKKETKVLKMIMIIDKKITDNQDFVTFHTYNT